MNNPTVEINEQLLAAMGLNAEATAILMERCINRDKAEMQTLRDQLTASRDANNLAADVVTVLQAQVMTLQNETTGLRTTLQSIALGKEPVAKRLAEESLGLQAAPAPTPPVPGSN